MKEPFLRLGVSLIPLYLHGFVVRAEVNRKPYEQVSFGMLYECGLSPATN